MDVLPALWRVILYLSNNRGTMNKDAKRIKPSLPDWAKRNFFCDGCKKEHGPGAFQNRTVDGKDLCDRQYYKLMEV